MDFGYQLGRDWFQLFRAPYERALWHSNVPESAEREGNLARSVEMVSGNAFYVEGNCGTLIFSHLAFNPKVERIISISDSRRCDDRAIDRKPDTIARLCESRKTAKLPVSDVESTSGIQLVRANVIFFIRRNTDENIHLVLPAPVIEEANNEEYECRCWISNDEKDESGNEPEGHVPPPLVSSAAGVIIGQAKRNYKTSWFSCLVVRVHAFSPFFDPTKRRVRRQRSWMFSGFS